MKDFIIKHLGLVILGTVIFVVIIAVLLIPDSLNTHWKQPISRITIGDLFLLILFAGLVFKKDK